MNRVLTDPRFNLPETIADRIAREIHELNFHRVLFSIVHQVVWVRADGKASFMVSNSQNYYLVLDQDWPRT